MRYILTESQYNKVKFMRRVGQTPKQFLKNSYSYQNPCEFKSFHHFIQRLMDDGLFDWMDYEDMVYYTDFIQGDMWDELHSYYDENCKHLTS